MEIVVVLQQPSAAILNAGDDGSTSDDVELDALRAALDDLHIALKPVHPNTADPSLQTYFTVTNAPTDIARCQVLAGRLRQQPVVAGAYVKPTEEPAPG